MPREFPAKKSNTRPDDDIGDCPAVSPKDYLCTRNRNHYGPHDAKGINDNSFMQWEDHQSVPDPQPREQHTPRQ